MGLQACTELRRGTAGDGLARTAGPALIVDQQQPLAVLDDRGVVEFPSFKARIVSTGVGIERIPVPQSRAVILWLFTRSCSKP